MYSLQLKQLPTYLLFGSDDLAFCLHLSSFFFLLPTILPFIPFLYQPCASSPAIAQPGLEMILWTEIYRDKEPGPASHLYIKDHLTLRISSEGSWGRFLLFISLWSFFLLFSLKCAVGASCKKTPLTSVVQMKLHFDTEFDSVVSFEECMF